MKGKIPTTIGIIAFAGTIVFSAGVGAQERHAAVSSASRPTAYDASRETTLQGTVVSYTEESSRAPIGARVTVQTARGPVDVHLGPASYLRSNHFSLSVGDSVRFVGVNISGKCEQRVSGSHRAKGHASLGGAIAARISSSDERHPRVAAS